MRQCQDAEALKNLCQMGFSRSHALAALEENNFDMQKALNGLLGLRAEAAGRAGGERR